MFQIHFSRPAQTYPDYAAVVNGYVATVGQLAGPAAAQVN